ncbi:MAG TPA: DotU family type IV/VI secretion system protein [Chthoniobacteraceae bacterium]|jgi:type VI protein secretion system component VasF|nr:DotU family type IV/VI secretion system protein [Chthoniobacteraceae bacterium]
MKALQLYEPLFQYLCELNRLARGGYIPSYADVRREVMGRLADVSMKAEDDPALRDHLRALKTPVNYIVDGLIVQNKLLPFRTRWHEERLGFRKDGLAGDEAFFSEHLDPALKETPTMVGAERLLVYYVALGLGFQGFYFHSPDKLRNYMKALQPAVRHWLVEDRVDLLVPQAYDYTDRRDLTRPPKLRGGLVLAGIVALLLCAVSIYAWLAHLVIKTADQQIHLREIGESHQGSPWPSSVLK